MGLAISTRIAEMHGGKIWIDSVVGQGSTFWVTLPITAEKQVKLAAPAPTYAILVQI